MIKYCQVGLTRLTWQLYNEKMIKVAFIITCSVTFIQIYTNYLLSILRYICKEIECSPLLSAKLGRDFASNFATLTSINTTLIFMEIYLSSS